MKERYKEMTAKNRPIRGYTVWTVKHNTTDRENTRKNALKICDTFNIIYELLYTGAVECDEDIMVARGDKWIRENAGTPLFRAICDNRRDIFTSDREVCALALTLGI